MRGRTGSVRRLGASVSSLLALSLLVFALPPGQSLGTQLQHVTITAETQRAGETEEWRVSFEAPRAANYNGYIVGLKFPPVFAIPAEPGCAFDGNVPVSGVDVVGQEVRCTIGSVNIAERQLLTMRVSDITNPDTAQSGLFDVYVYNWPSVLAEDTSHSVNVVANVFDAVSTSAEDGRAGETTEWNLAFTPKVGVNPLGDARVVFPEGFEVLEGVDCDITIEGDLEAHRVSASEVVCDLGTHSLDADVPYELTISNVKNPPVSKSPVATLLTLQTRSPTDALHESNSNLGLEVVAHPFQDASAVADSNAAGALVTYSFTFTTFNPWPADGCFQARFSDGVTLNPAQTFFAIAEGATGGFSTTQIEGQSAKACRADGALAVPGSEVALTLSNVRLPSNPDETVEIAISSATASWAAIDTGFFEDLLEALIGCVKDCWPPPPPPPGAPDAPQNPQAAAGQSPGSILLKWMEPADNGGSQVTGYKVYRAQSSSGPFVLVRTLGNNQTYVDTGLGNGAKRFYQVTAVNEKGEGNRSPTVSATTSGSATTSSPRPSPTPSRVDPVGPDGTWAPGSFSPGDLLNTIRNTPPFVYGGALVLLLVGVLATVGVVRWRVKRIGKR